MTVTGGNRLRAWATTIVVLLSTLFGAFPQASMVWLESQAVCADVAVTVAVNPGYTPTVHLLDYRITAGHSHGPPASVDVLTPDTHTYYVLAGSTPVLVHNSGPDCGMPVGGHIGDELGGQPFHNGDFTLDEYVQFVNGHTGDANPAMGRPTITEVETTLRNSGPTLLTGQNSTPGR